MPATLSISLADAEAQLSTVSAALQSLIAGTRLTQFKIGSGSFAREYTYQEITIDNLRQLQQEYLDDIAWYQSQQTGTLPTFSSNKTIPLMVRKEYFNPFRGIY